MVGGDHPQFVKSSKLTTPLSELKLLTSFAKLTLELGLSAALAPLKRATMSKKAIVFLLIAEISQDFRSAATKKSEPSDGPPESDGVSRHGRDELALEQMSTSPTEAPFTGRDEAEASWSLPVRGPNSAPKPAHQTSWFRSQCRRWKQAHKHVRPAGRTLKKRRAPESAP